MQINYCTLTSKATSKKNKSFYGMQDVIWQSFLFFFQWGAYSSSAESLFQQGAGRTSSRMLWSQMGEAHVPQYESCVAGEGIKAPLFITIAFRASSCLRSRSTALPCASCFQEKVQAGAVGNHCCPQPPSPFPVPSSSRQVRCQQTHSSAACRWDWAK